MGSRFARAAIRTNAFCEDLIAGIDVETSAAVLVEFLRTFRQPRASMRGNFNVTAENAKNA
jgi:hypothetical protein